MIRSVRLSLVLAALASSMACNGDALLCGADTTIVDGECVSTLIAIECGPGTSLDEGTGECRAVVECGPGTVYDASARECRPEATCGTGTALNPATGLCEPLYSCGEGTTPDPQTGDCIDTTQCGADTTFDDVSGECVPVDTCGDGTTYHPLTHLCTPDVTCGPGLFASGGLCLSDTDLLGMQADATEGVPDTNDPAFGGTPEVLVLEPVGESLVFSGAIGRPVDLDGDELEDQDRDLWSFEGVAGQVLRIAVLDNGLPQPSFLLEGPEGYTRTSRLGVVSEPDRVVVLPHDGTYTMTIVPVGVFAQNEAGPLIGDPDFGYIGVIEELPAPAVIPLSPGQFPDAVAATGSILGVLDNFFALESDEPAGLMLDFVMDDVQTEPAVLLFSAAGVFLEEVILEEEDGKYALVQGAWADEDGGLLVVVDWVTSVGFDTSFSVEALTLEVTEAGAVGTDATLVAPGEEIAGLFGRVFAFEAPAGQVLTTGFLGLNKPQVTLVGPSGVVGTWDSLDREQAFAVADEAGTYRWLAVNRDKSDRQVSFSVTTQTAAQAGTFDLEGDAPFANSGEVLQSRAYGPETSWTHAGIGAPLVLDVRTSFLSGMPDFQLYQKDPRGRLVEIRDATEEEPGRLRAAFDEAPAEAFFLITPVNITPPNPAVRDWTVDVTAYALPPLLDTEPNDTVGAAQVVDTLPAQFSGTLFDEQFDVFRIEPSTPLGTDDILQVTFEALDTLKATRLSVLDLNGDTLHSINTRRLTRWRFFEDDGPAPYFIEFEGLEDDFEYRYIVDVERIAAPTESEPNDSVGVANPLSVVALPYRISGKTIKGEPDVFTLDIPAPLAAGEVLRVRLHNDADSSDLNLTWVDDIGADIISARHEDAVLFVPVVGTETVRLRVEGNSTTSEDIYTLSVTIESDVEQEPNDDFVNAHPLSVSGVPVRVNGQDVRGAVDTYRVDLLAPASDDEHLSVRYTNELERGDFQLRLYDIAGTELFFVEDYATEVVSPLPAVDQMYFTMVPDSFSANSRRDIYQVEVVRALGAAEHEPNDDIGTAENLTLPAFVQGQSRTDDTDLYRVTLASALAADQPVRIRVDTLFEPEDMVVEVTDMAGGQIGLFENTQVDAEVLLPDVFAGDFFLVEVRSQLTNSGEHTRYALEVTAP